jgi:hypothetical protein
MQEYVKVQALNNAVEAGLLEVELTKRRIPHLIVSFHDSAYDGLFQSQKGWGVVKAPCEYENEIKAIYRDLSSRDWEPVQEDDDL